MKICVRGIKKTFISDACTVEALNGVDLNVEDSEFMGLIGPSGCGKSTLLKIIAGVEKPTNGFVEFVGSPQNKPIVAMIFQQVTLLPWRRVDRNIMFPLETGDAPKSVRERITGYFIRLSRLIGFEKSFPTELSCGMQRQSEIARALASSPEVLLLDEPFCNLDSLTRLKMQQELLRIWREYKKTMIYATHDIHEAVLLCDRIAVMTARPGKIREIVKVDLPRPRELDALTNPNYVEALKHIRSLVKEEVEKTSKEPILRSKETSKRKIFLPEQLLI